MPSSVQVNRIIKDSTAQLRAMLDEAIAVRKGTAAPARYDFGLCCECECLADFKFEYIGFSVLCDV